MNKNNKLKFLRTEADLSVREFADYVHINNFSIVTRIELGKADSIKTELLDKMCNFFMVEPNYFLGYSENGIICKIAGKDKEVVITESEYKKLKSEIYFNPQDGRVMTKYGLEDLDQIRSADLGFNLMYILNSMMKRDAIKEILPLLNQLDDSQLEHILNTIKLFIRK